MGSGTAGEMQWPNNGNQARLKMTGGGNLPHLQSWKKKGRGGAYLTPVFATARKEQILDKEDLFPRKRRG